MTEQLTREVDKVSETTDWVSTFHGVCTGEATVTAAGF